MTARWGTTEMSNLLKFLAYGLFASMLLTVAACVPDADVVSQNISTDADNFKVQRRVVFYNGITGDYMLSLEGLCSLGNHDGPKEVTVTCKVGPGAYKKHFLGLSDNVTYFVEQMDPIAASPYHYKVIFKPSVIVPDIEVR
jgi:hypothetical protein